MEEPLFSPDGKYTSTGDGNWTPIPSKWSRIIPKRTWFYPLLNILTPLGYKKCKSDELLFVTKSYKLIYCINNSGTMVWPMLRSATKVSLKPIQIKIKLLYCLGKNGERYNINSVFNIGISINLYLIKNFSERCLGQEKAQMKEFVQEVITGQLRLAVHESIIENISMENNNFMNLLYENITTELQKLGLYLIEINEMTLLDSESENIISSSTNIIYENPEHKPERSDDFRAFGHRYLPKGKVIIDKITTNECYICKKTIQRPHIFCDKCRIEPLSARYKNKITTTNTSDKGSSDYLDIYKQRGGRATVNISDSSSPSQSSNQSKSICKICGENVMPNSRVSKAVKTVAYTPVSSWFGATIGMAFGGLPGLFLGGLMGGAGGIAKANEDKSLCNCSSRLSAEELEELEDAHYEMYPEETF